MSKSWGIVIGRFQVPRLHAGHLELINRVAGENNLMFLVGVHPDKPNIQNPLSFLARRQLLQEEYQDALILPITDMREDKKWSENVDRVIRSAIGLAPAKIFVGRDSRVPKCYSGSYTVVELPGSQPHISSTKIRESISVTGNEFFREGIIYAVNQAVPVLSLAVDMAVLNPDGEVLLARKPEESKWRFPGGMVDPGVDLSFQMAAGREFHEETGIIVQRSTWKYVGDFQVDDWRGSPEARHFHHTVLFTSQLPWHGNPVANDDVTEVDWFPLWIWGKDVMDLVVEEHQPLWSALQHFYTE